MSPGVLLARDLIAGPELAGHFALLFQAGYHGRSVKFDMIWYTTYTRMIQDETSCRRELSAPGQEHARG